VSRFGGVAEWVVGLGVVLAFSAIESVVEWFCGFYPP
jgi:hypothetical protein